MKIALANVVVEDRHRRTLGDLESLARSIELVGLLHPIVISPEKRLIAGERRLRAAELLGWTSIEARVVNLENMLLGERDENTERKNLTPTEMVALARALAPIEQEAAKERQGTRTDLELPGESPGSEDGQARDRVAAAVGTSTNTLAKATAVVEAAEDDPEQFADIAEKMDETGKVDPAHRELQERRSPIEVDFDAPRHCPACGRDTPGWVLDGRPRPEGAPRYKWIARLVGRVQ